MADPKPLLTRRQALTTAALAGLSLPFGAARALGADTPASAAPRKLPSLGLAGYSLRKFVLDEAVAVARKLELAQVAVFRVHVPVLIGTPDQCAVAAKAFRDAGLDIVSTGVVALEASEASMRRAFECGKAAGLPMMAASYKEKPTAGTLALTEKFVREYNIRIAFHNHGPEDAIFPSPYDVLNAVGPYDARMGLCLDVGHAARYGVDPVEAIHRCHGRMLEVHFKDSVAPVGAKHDIPTGLGRGRLDLRAIMAALLEVGYSGPVNLEYEVDAPDPVPGMAQSLGYMRGLLCGVAAPTTAS